MVKLPDGSEQKPQTDVAGRVDLSANKEGTAEVGTKVDGVTLDNALVFVKFGALSSQQQKASSSPNGQSGKDKIVVQAVEHRVKTGQTLDSIASQYGLSKDTLTKFNWNTTDPDKIDKRLRLEVGCTKRGSDNHMAFDDTDTPGVIRVPAPLRLRGLVLDKLHIMRVTPARRKPVFPLSI